MLPDAFWAFAERYISLDTSQAHGNAGIEPLLTELHAALGLAPRFTAQRATHLGKAQLNLLASFGPVQDGGLLLVTHSDTVPPGPIERWTKGPPHKLTRDGDNVIGLGVADVKLDYLCKAFALQRVDRAALKKPVHLLATHSEEVGLVGAKAFADAGLCKPEWALCGEPSELIPCHAHKGYAVAKVTVKATNVALVAATHRIEITGKAAHSSTPHLGVNAIDRLAAWLAEHPSLEVTWVRGGSSANTVPASAHAYVRAPSELPHPVESNVSLLLHEEHGLNLRPAFDAMQQLWSEWQALANALTPSRDDDFWPPEVVCNFGMLSSDGGALSATFDARLLPGHDPTALHEQFAAKARAFDATVIVERAAPGMKNAADSPLLQALDVVVSKRGLSGKPKAKATSTEAGVFFRKGIDAAVFGPGVSLQNAHTPNEWNRVRDLELAIDIYEDLILRLCG